VDSRDFLFKLGGNYLPDRSTWSSGGKDFRLVLGGVLRITLFLYIFAFLDAFFTAREMTAGTDAFIVESPRVAAILNLLTRGFGYFYLGKSTLGFAVFIGLGVFQQMTMRSMTDKENAGGGLCMELVQIGLAADAYRIAGEREKQILATSSSFPGPPAIFRPQSR
jgi:hypothetical protein